MTLQAVSLDTDEQEITTRLRLGSRPELPTILNFSIN